MTLLSIIAVGAVTLVLAFGLFNMLRGGSPSKSQMLMRWRVILQAVAVLILMGIIWWRNS